MEVNFYAMKRKQLRLLCKKHRIPANITNNEMAKRLTLHKVQMRKGKKVSFNPETEIFFFESTPKYTYFSLKKKMVQKRKFRLKQASKKKQVQLTEIGRELELSLNKIVTPCRLTRSSSQRIEQQDAVAMSLTFSVLKNIRSIENNVGGNELTMEVNLIEGVGGGGTEMLL